MGNESKEDKEDKEAKRKRSDTVRRSQILDLTKELDILREETNTLKKENSERIEIQQKSKQEYEDKIKSLENTIESLQITHDPLSKPSFHKKTEQNFQKDITKKNAEIMKLKEEIKQIQTKYNNLEIELKEEN